MQEYNERDVEASPMPFAMKCSSSDLIKAVASPTASRGIRHERREFKTRGRNSSASTRRSVEMKTDKIVKRFIEHTSDDGDYDDDGGYGDDDDDDDDGSYQCGHFERKAFCKETGNQRRPGQVVMS